MVIPPGRWPIGRTDHRIPDFGIEKALDEAFKVITMLKSIFSPKMGKK
jgi:hypothetical protein